jgi:hypothetical protein
MFKPKPIVSHGVKKTKQYHVGRLMARNAALRVRRVEYQQQGVLLDVKKQLRMEVKRNPGIGWGRSLLVCKHLEMHERGRGPPVDQQFREKVADIIHNLRFPFKQK